MRKALAKRSVFAKRFLFVHHTGSFLFHFYSVMSRNNGYNNYGNSNSTQGGDEKRVIGRTGYARVVPSSQQQQQQVYRTGSVRTSPSPAPQAYSLGYLNVDVEPNPEYCVLPATTSPRSSSYRICQNSADPCSGTYHHLWI